MTKRLTLGTLKTIVSPFCRLLEIDDVFVKRIREVRLCLWENFTKVNSDYVFKNINIVNNSERTILGVVCRSLNLKIVKYSSACMKSLSIDLTYAENDFI